MARVRELSGASQAHDGGRFDAAWRDEATLDYLAPIDDADKFLCVGKNYRQHLEELQRTNLIKEIPARADRLRQAQLEPGRPPRQGRPARRASSASTTSPSWCS